LLNGLAAPGLYDLPPPAVRKRFYESHFHPSDGAALTAWMSVNPINLVNPVNLFIVFISLYFALVLTETNFFYQ
ncbi:MAG: hypothetical protein KBA08_10370, partial [Firmicutes bacterium]|nr:hypothetical protein [Bacillota bacterium]